MNIQKMLEWHDDLCHWVERFVRTPEAEQYMGGKYWLRHVIYDTDTNLEFYPETLNVWGHTFSSQTQSHEYFEFYIPWEIIPDELKADR